MTHTSISSHALRVISNSFLIAGMVTLIVSDQQSTYAGQIAQLSEQGATMIVRDDETVAHSTHYTLQPASELHASAPIDAGYAYVSVQLIVGMFLILIGFCIHALLIMKNERPVHVTEIRRTHRASEPATTRRYLEMYWIER